MRQRTGPGTVCIVPGAPVGKPRMTQRDKWAKRPSVLRYWNWADRCRTAARGVDLRNVESVTIYASMPMPASWSKRKRLEMSGAAHRQKPDIDNVIKAVLDALLPDGDHGVWRVIAEKYWGPDEGYVRVDVGMPIGED